MPHHLITTALKAYASDRYQGSKWLHKLAAKKDLLQGRSILVVEDEYLIALEAQRIIEDAGVDEVFLANSIEDVRKLLEDGPRIDAIVLDLKLGEEDASPLIGELATRKIPLLVTTGFDITAPSEVQCLTKPYREAELIEAILRLFQPDQC